MIWAVLLGCHTSNPDGVCFDVEETLGFLPCVHQLQSQEAFEDVSVVATVIDQNWTTKYMVPVTQSTPIDEPLFVDAQRYDLHQDFLAEAFPRDFGDITAERYTEMVISPDDRLFFSGDLTEYIDEDGQTFPGFIIWDGIDDAETVTQEDVTVVWNALRDRVGFGDIAFVPRSSNQLNASNGWDAPFPIVNIQDNVTYEAYTTGVGYGTIRRYTIDVLEEATENADFGYQDILILDEAPWDLEMVVSGLVTGTRQSALSHLNVRSAARGTPNCFIKSPHAMLELYDGRLVRFACEEDVWRIEETSWAEAEAFWEELRPEPVEIPAPDLDTTELINLLDLPTGSATMRANSVAAYGSKGANLAILYRRIDTERQLNGFLIPMSAYATFMEENSWWTDLGEGDVLATFQDTIDHWLSNDDFLADAVWRRECLAALRDAMKDATVDPLLLADIGEMIEHTWGNDTTMVRFRSSSNAEDALSFSGAGLYDSTSACLADQRDDDNDGTSHCDRAQDDERDIERALRVVWSSLWNMGAFEEREWYGIDHSQAMMGVLVNTRSKDERVNIVLFSGDPLTDDDRFLVNAQDGDHDVVSGEPGLTPEVVRLTISDGSVAEITREAHSSLSPDSWLLSRDQLEELGAAMADVAHVFPVDAESGAHQTALLDTEWKVLSDGRLIIKQVRPFLRED